MRYRLSYPKVIVDIILKLQLSVTKNRIVVITIDQFTEISIIPMKINPSYLNPNRILINCKLVWTVFVYLCLIVNSHYINALSTSKKNPPLFCEKKCNFGEINDIKFPFKRKVLPGYSMSYKIHHLTKRTHAQTDETISFNFPPIQLFVLSNLLLNRYKTRVGPMVLLTLT